MTVLKKLEFDKEGEYFMDILLIRGYKQEILHSDPVGYINHGENKKIIITIEEVENGT